MNSERPATAWWCFCCHGQTETGDFIGATVFVYSHSALLDSELPTRLVLRDWACGVDHDSKCLAADFNNHYYSCIFSPAGHS